MISLIEDYDDGRYRAIPFVSLARVVFTLQYVLKPIDIIPDSLPVIGELDDALVVAHCLALVRQDLRAYGVWRLSAGRGAHPVLQAVKTRGSLTTNDGEIAVRFGSSAG